jgi:acyl dehydratase
MLPEQVTQMMGKTGDPMIFEVERGAIKKFADAVGDLNPLYWDHEYAKKSRYGAIIAPPGFFGWPVKWTSAMPLQQEIRMELMDALAKAGFDRVLDGGIEYEFFQPVYENDTLAVLVKIAEINAKETKGGTLVFSIVETSFTNQHGVLVAISRQTVIAR